MLTRIGVIHALEKDLRRPVLAANQVAFWHVIELPTTSIQIACYAGGGEAQRRRRMPPPALGTRPSDVFDRFHRIQI
jgi:hypothetical protein